MYKVGDWVLWVGKGRQRAITHRDYTSQMKAQIVGTSVTRVKGTKMLFLEMMFPGLDNMVTSYLEDKVIPFTSPTPDWEV